MKPIERRLVALETRGGKGVQFSTVVICKIGETPEDACSRVFAGQEVPPDDELFVVHFVAPKPRLPIEDTSAAAKGEG